MTQINKQLCNLNKNKSKKFDNEMEYNKKSTTHMWKYGTGKTPNRLTISTWNVNGIRGVMNKKQFIPYINKYNPDIICLNQTKVDQQSYNKLKIQLHSYYAYWNFCKCSSGYSGVAVLSKYQPIRMIQDFQQKQHSQEGRLITLQFQKFYLVAVYLPSSGKNLQRLNYRVYQYDPIFHKHCQQIKSKSKPVIIAGDLNVAHKDIDTYIAKSGANKGRALQHLSGVTPLQRKSFTKFLEMGWVDVFREFHPDKVEYTWWNMKYGGRDKNIGWRLDYIIVDKESLKYIKSVNIRSEITGSDHCPIETRIDLEEKQKPKLMLIQYLELINISLLINIIASNEKRRKGFQYHNWLNQGKINH